MNSHSFILLLRINQSINFFIRNWRNNQLAIITIFIHIFILKNSFYTPKDAFRIQIRNIVSTIKLRFIQWMVFFFIFLTLPLFYADRGTFSRILRRIPRFCVRIVSFPRPAHPIPATPGSGRCRRSHCESPHRARTAWRSRTR